MDSRLLQLPRVCLFLSPQLLHDFAPMASPIQEVFFVFHIHPIYPHSSFPVILKFLLNSTYITLNPRTSTSVIAIYYTEDIPEVWLKGRTPSEKGVAQINDSLTTEVDFFKRSLSFWKGGNWFSCLLKHHHKVRR